MKILLTNDDGIEAEGLNALVSKLRDKATLFVVAPSDQMSATSHSISLGQRLCVREEMKWGIKCYSVSGTPADCVKIAISELEFLPNLIISGINHGSNTGVSVYYSGTVSAAREGLINKIPSIAISLCSKTFNDFSVSSDIALKLVEDYSENLYPTNVMLNVNVPPLFVQDIKGVKIAKQAASRFVEEFICEENNEKKDAKNYTLAGEIELYDPDGTGDEEAVNDGYIAITPLKLDLTDYEAMRKFEKVLKEEK